ncbi:DUF6587 family protein [Nevskia soli]|uniref:DUF6587 family protein n=1 Tax=Nevskia soli TaxID=418856 RepID=UPI0004A76B30|nr:DUF6587 family protein [Nevskia soli]
MNDALQYLIVALIVIPSAFYAVGVFSPQTRRRVQRSAALWLLKAQHPAKLRQFGLRILPVEQAKGCGAGCSDCNNCAPPAQSPEQPLLDLRTPPRR